MAIRPFLLNTSSWMSGAMTGVGRVRVLMGLAGVNAVIAGYMGALNLSYLTMDTNELSSTLGTGLPETFTFMDGLGFVVFGAIFLFLACASIFLAWWMKGRSPQSRIAAIVLFSMNAVLAATYLFLHIGIVNDGHYIWWEEFNALLSILIVIILALPGTAAAFDAE